MSRVFLVMGLACVLPACGYADVPLPLREHAELVVESIEAFPGRNGRVQIRLDLPGDVSGPVVVVGHPTVAAPGSVRVVAWAHGACPQAVAATPDGRRLCLALRYPTVTRPGDITLSVVVEARAEARRFTLSGVAEAP